MNKNEFLKRLDSRLMGMPKEDREDAINYYKEYFIDAGVEDNQDVIPIVGTPDKAARKIIDECTDKTLNEQKKYGGAKNNAKLLWLVILGIFAAPIAFPIALIICAVVFSVIIVIVAVLAALFGTAVALTVVFIAMIPGIFWATSTGQAFVIAGMSCLGIAFGIVMTLCFIKLINLFIRFIVFIFRTIFVRKKVA